MLSLGGVSERVKTWKWGLEGIRTNGEGERERERERERGLRLRGEASRNRGLWWQPGTTYPIPNVSGSCRMNGLSGGRPQHGVEWEREIMLGQHSESLTSGIT